MLENPDWSALEQPSFALHAPRRYRTCCPASERGLDQMGPNAARLYQAQVRIDGILHSMYAEALNYESGAAEIERKAQKRFPTSELQLVAIEMLPEDVLQLRDLKRP